MSTGGVAIYSGVPKHYAGYKIFVNELTILCDVSVTVGIMLAFNYAKRQKARR